MTTVLTTNGVTREELEREQERAAAAIILRRSPTPIAMPVDVIVDLVAIELALSPEDAQRRRGLMKLHLTDELPKKTQLRVVVIGGEECLTLSEWCDGQSSLFAITAEAPTQPSLAVDATDKAPLRPLTGLLNQVHFDALAAEAKRREWSHSHMLRWIVGEWHAQHRKVN